MEKAVIEFLRKSGYTLSEIMKMDESTNADTNTDTDADTNNSNDTGTQTEQNTDAKTEETAKSEIEIKLDDLKNQLKELRDITHAQNIKHDVLEDEPEKPLEEQVEELLKEVNK